MLARQSPRRGQRQKASAAPDCRSKLRPQPHSEYRCRAAIPVVAWVGYELVVERGAPVRYGQAVVHLDDLLEPVVRKLPIAKEEAEATGIEIGAVGFRDTIEGAGDTNGIVWPPPSVSFQGE